jgi:preprotein translocase YajC subunit
MALLLPLIVLAAFLLFRANPQKRRAQAQKTLADSLRPGVRVATVAGVIGTLVGIEGDRAAIEIAPDVIVEFLLASITRTIDDRPVPLDGAPSDIGGHGDVHDGDHLGGDHLEGDHLGGDHLGGDHLGGDHLGGDHLGGDHLGGDHLGGDHLGGDHHDAGGHDGPHGGTHDAADVPEAGDVPAPHTEET